MPRENAKDLRDIPKRVLKTLKVVPVDHMDEVLRHALVLPDAGRVPHRALGARRLAPASRAPRSGTARRGLEDAGGERGPPPSALEEQPSGPIGDGRSPPPSPDGDGGPGQSPDTAAHRGPMPGLGEH